MWPDPSQTSELLLAARAGDESARNRLLDGHRAPLRRAIEVRLDPVLRRRVDASDIVQDVLIEANRRLADYLADPRMPFGLWLRHLARDRLIDAHRRHRVAGRRSLDREQSLAGGDSGHSALDLVSLVADGELTPAATAAFRELEGRFFSAVETLDESDREVILMRHFDQLSNQEVAQTLGLTPPAAGMRYLRAMRRLWAIFKDPAASQE